VLAEGDEVVIEFEEALDVAEPENEFGDFVEATESMVPSEAISEAAISEAISEATKGQALGGAIRYNADGSRWNPWKDI
jgi:hypothetical protein